MQVLLLFLVSQVNLPTKHLTQYDLDTDILTYTPYTLITLVNKILSHERFIVFLT
jgi:hypothetical protein